MAWLLLPWFSLLQRNIRGNSALINYQVNILKNPLITLSITQPDFVVVKRSDSSGAQYSVAYLFIKALKKDIAET